MRRMAMKEALVSIRTDVDNTLGLACCHVRSLEHKFAFCGIVSSLVCNGYTAMDLPVACVQRCSSYRLLLHL